MLFLTSAFLCLIIWYCMENNVIEGACEYPSELRGEWFSTSNGLLNFSNDSIDNLKTNAHATPTTFTCEFIKGSQYISKSEIQIFTNQKYTVYLCMTFSRISDSKYTFTYNTDIDPSTKQRLLGILTPTSSASVTYAQACNLSSSIPIGTQELLIRKDVINSSGISCPSVIQSTFDVTLGQTCNSTVLYGSVDTTQLQYNYSSCVTTSLSFSASYQSYRVLRATAILQMATRLFFKGQRLTEVISSNNNVVYSTYFPQICQPNQTSTYVNSPGVQGVYTNISNVNSSCPPPSSHSVSRSSPWEQRLSKCLSNMHPISSSSDSSTGFPVAAIVVIVIISIIIICVVLIIIAYLFWKKKRPYVEDCSTMKTACQLDHQQETSGEDECGDLDDPLIPTTSDGKKKYKRKRREKKKYKTPEDRTKSAVSRKVILNEDLNTVMDENRAHPEWQKRWETFQDPVSRGCPPDSTSLREKGNSRPGTARSVTTVWVMPEKDEEKEVLSAWDKVSVLWNSVSRKNPTRQNNAQYQFTNHVHM